VSLTTIGSLRTITLGFLPKTMTTVPLTYLAATVSLIFTLVSLTLLGRGWERDTLPQKFVDWNKMWAVVTLLVSCLPAMIFLSVVFQEWRRG
jgi:hypothetical protein